MSIGYIKKFLNSKSPGQSGFASLDKMIENSTSSINNNTNSKTTTITNNITNLGNTLKGYHLQQKRLLTSSQITATNQNPATHNNVVSITGPGVLHSMFCYDGNKGHYLTASTLNIDGVLYINNVNSAPIETRPTANFGIALTDNGIPVLNASTSSNTSIFGFRQFSNIYERGGNTYFQIPFKNYCRLNCTVWYSQINAPLYYHVLYSLFA